MIRQKYNFSEKMLSQVVTVVVRKEDNWDNHDNFFVFATQNVEVMDFFGFMVINCSCDDMSRSFYHHLFWSSDDAYYIEGPIRYGKKGRPMVEISFERFGFGYHSHHGRWSSFVRNNRYYPVRKTGYQPFGETTLRTDFIMLSKLSKLSLGKEDNLDNHDNTNRSSRSVLRLGCENSAKSCL